MVVTNQFIDIGDITFKSAETLYAALGFTKNVNRSYDDRFGRAGAKIGSVTQARVPGRFTFTPDTSSTAIQIQALNDAAMPVTLNKNYQQAVSVDMTDLSLSVDDFGERYLTPMMLTMAQEIDRDGQVAGLTYAQNAVGTPGTAPNSLATTQALFSAAFRKQTENFAPAGQKIMVSSTPQLNEIGYTYMTSLFNPSSLISDLQKEGIVANASGMYFQPTQLMPSYTTGTYTGTGEVTTANQSGSTINTSGWGGSTTLDVGAVVTFEGVYAVNPITKDSLGYLQQFSITAKNAAGAAQALQISPAMVGPGSPRQNVSALPAAGADVTVLGATGVTSNMSLAYNRDFLIFATADIGISNTGTGPLNKDGGANWFTASVPELGLSVYCSMQYDIRSRSMLLRLDLLGGWAPLYPQLGTKIISS